MYRHISRYAHFAAETYPRQSQSEHFPEIKAVPTFLRQNRQKIVYFRFFADVSIPI